MRSLASGDGVGLLCQAHFKRFSDSGKIESEMKLAFKVSRTPLSVKENNDLIDRKSFFVRKTSFQDTPDSEIGSKKTMIAKANSSGTQDPMNETLRIVSKVSFLYDTIIVTDDHQSFPEPRQTFITTYP